MQTKPTFENLLADVSPEYREFISDLRCLLCESECAETVELKRSGYFASYVFSPAKKSLLNLLFRKKGMLVRIYARHTAEYEEF